MGEPFTINSFVHQTPTKAKKNITFELDYKRHFRICLRKWVYCSALALNARYLAEDLDLFGLAHAIKQEDRALLDALTQPSCEMEAPGGCCHAA